MKLTKDQKKEGSKTLGEAFKASSTIYFTGYQGLKFVELAELRTQLRKQQGAYTIVKNSLLENALKQAGIEGGDPKLLQGPNAIVVSRGGDPVSTAKVLFKFAKDFPNLKLKAGYVGAQWISAADCQRLSMIGSRPEVLAKLAGVFYSAVAQSAGVLAAPIRDFVMVLQALEKKKSTEAAA